MTTGIKPAAPAGNAKPMTKANVNAVDAAAQAAQTTKMTEIFAALSVAADRTAGTAEVASLVKGSVGALAAAVDKFKAAGAEKAAPARLAAVEVFAAIAKAAGTTAQPFLAAALPTLLDLHADKDKKVREAADAAGKAFFAELDVNALRTVMPTLFTAMTGPNSAKLWQGKVAALQLLATFSIRAAAQTKEALPDLIPVVSDCMWDTRTEVQAAAQDTMTAICQQIGNKDIAEFIPAVISCIAKPPEVPECVHKLASTTFVQQVEPPALAIMVPVLARALKERVTAVKRNAAVIIDNMCKMVEVPAYAAPFVPKLLPELQKVSQEVSDPECRAVADRAAGTLARAAGDGRTVETVVVPDAAAVLAGLKETIKGAVPELYEPVLAFTAGLVQAMIARKCFEEAEWTAHVQPFLAIMMAKDAAAATTAAYRGKVATEEASKDNEVDDNYEGEDLCNCEFVLGYGNRILLNAARLHLKRGHKYSLRGSNGCGKSTLLRAIANEQLEGFPPQSELMTVFVEHDIKEEETNFTIMEFVRADKALAPILARKGITDVFIHDLLLEMGFLPNMLQDDFKVWGLSGGWKMKLALARASMMDADILLMDEPTNHLDVKNHAWVTDYVKNVKASIIVVSDDQPFTDAVCTDVLNFEGLKIKRYTGNTARFFEVRPDLATRLNDSKVPKFKFSFPEPGMLIGVKDRNKAILKMKDVEFTYPNTTRPILKGVSVFLSLNSRVAVLGPNGAGKSTMIKLLTGELEPCAGDVWKHPNMRYGYVAQHAFHHLEQHMDMTPNEYIQWRYSSGYDKEETTKVNKNITEEEEKKMKTPLHIEGVKKVIEKLLARRQVKGAFEYECSFVGKPAEENKWISKDKLEELGFKKVIEQCDERELAAASMLNQPATKSNVEKHLNGFGLETEYATHSRIRGLSGGQKVKVVMAAATWLRPHVLVLDEPTNYLDRDSLNALAAAIKDFQGGVVMITHNFDFSTGLCQEEWICQNGVLTPKGQPIEAPAEKIEWKPQEEVLDALGNTVAAPKEKKKKLSRQEQKARDKMRKFRIENGETVSDEEDD